VISRPEPLFGINIDPGTTDPNDAFARAAIADNHGIDLALIQDHPYIDRFFDTWMLLAMIAARTEHVHLGTNVSPLPLRPPAMLAKAAATIDVLSGGRVELGIGAGGFPQGIAAFGGTTPPTSEIVPAFDEALRVIRDLWESEHGFNFSGDHYAFKGTRFGPKPAHPIRIWVGAAKPRMFRLTGRLADGVLVSNAYVPETQLAEVNQQIDNGAARAGRTPDQIRRGYNLMGAIDLPGSPNKQADLRPGTPLLDVDGWVEHLIHLYRDCRIDTLIFWPFGERHLEQTEVFASEVVPAVKKALANTP
jgi:alkanesulfonate monooxygenase SsuD/methylene tetrahydromethanopterin reductase-like flavin-dependent oxidoreductase (luciferase family)